MLVPEKNLSQITIAFLLLTCSFLNLKSEAAEYTVNEDVAPNSQATNNSRSELDFFRKLIDYYYASWSYWSDENGNVAPTELDDVAVLYTENPDAIYYDPLPPIEGYRGWQKFGQVYKTWAESNIVRADIRYGGELKVFRLSDNLVYTTSLADVDTYFADSRKSTLKPRVTHIWEDNLMDAG